METLLHPLVMWGLLIVGPFALFGFSAHSISRPHREAGQ